ncbi:MAG TPA: hypothetical protein DCL35_02600 [Candidatus Omnitrophica bacterium]|nr:hypothetical protein [Candidatus Omnitrophota bacterium]
MTKVNRSILLEKIRGYSSIDTTVSCRVHEVYIMLTLECNLKCAFCCWWGPNGPCRNPLFLKKYSPPANRRDIKRFIDEVAVFRPKTVNLSGGEPLIFDGWHDIALYLKRKEMPVSLTTNGLLLPAQSDKIHESVDDLNISFQGAPGSNIHNYMDMLKKGLKRLSKLKKIKNRGPKIRILYTLTGQTCGLFKKFRRFLKQEAIHVDSMIFQHRLFINDKTLKDHRAVFKKEFGILNTDFTRGFASHGITNGLASFKKHLKDIRTDAAGRFVPNLLDSEIDAYYNENEPPAHYSVYCSAPWHQVNLLPNGVIYTCNDYMLGNITKAYFPDIWNGPKARRLRKFISRRLFPACKGCFYYYTDRDA